MNEIQPGKDYAGRDYQVDHSKPEALINYKDYLQQARARNKEEKAKQAA